VNRSRRLLLTSVLGIALLLPGTVPGHAQEDEEASHGHHTVAVAVNTKDGSTVFKMAFQIIKVNGPVVDNINLAFAMASCTDCKTIAAAFQVVLVTGNATTVVPENYAIALNIECTDCQTLASAYQFVQSTGGPVTFTPEGQQALAEIRQSLHDLMQSAESLTLDEILAELDALAVQLAQVIAEELVAKGPPGLQMDVTEEDQDLGVEGGEPTTPPTPIDTGSPAPEDTPESPVPTATETTTPSPTTSG
jgi:putative peptide zinc metalloprotease protein